jgi:hypothetical protein
MIAMTGIYVAILLITLSSGYGQQTRMKTDSDVSEQRQFSAEEVGVEKPVPIPNDVLNELRKDQAVITMLDDKGISAERLPASWFSASLVHLGGSKEPDLIVKGEWPLLGANVTTFWVFIRTRNGHELGLSATAHNLLIRDHFENGRRVIECMSATASQVITDLFRYNGKQFVPYRHYKKLLPDGHSNR